MSTNDLVEVPPFDLTSEVVRRARFSVVRKGYAPVEVDGFLERLAMAVEQATERVQQLEAEEVRALTAFARQAVDRELDEARSRAAAIVAEAAKEREELDRERSSLAAERALLASELEQARGANREIGEALQQVEFERAALERRRAGLDDERAALRRERLHQQVQADQAARLRRRLLEETETEIAVRTAQSDRDLRAAWGEQCTWLLDAVARFVAELPPPTSTDGHRAVDLARRALAAASATEAERVRS